ncbi:hypothetical protein H632_c4744p0, partial [Helicosporidium sp. ATCC 50920]
GRGRGRGAAEPRGPLPRARRPGRPRGMHGSGPESAVLGEHGSARERGPARERGRAGRLRARAGRRAAGLLRRGPGQQAKARGGEKRRVRRGAARAEKGVGRGAARTQGGIWRGAGVEDGSRRGAGAKERTGRGAGCADAQPRHRRSGSFRYQGWRFGGTSLRGIRGISSLGRPSLRRPVSSRTPSSPALPSRHRPSPGPRSLSGGLHGRARRVRGARAAHPAALRPLRGAVAAPPAGGGKRARRGRG